METDKEIAATPEEVLRIVRILQRWQRGGRWLGFGWIAIEVGLPREAVEGVYLDLELRGLVTPTDTVVLLEQQRRRAALLQGLSSCPRALSGGCLHRGLAPS